MNLLSNSMKFTFQGWVKLYVSFSAETNDLKFAVSDSGIGNSEGERAKLFTLFGKLNAVKKINTQGIGLGLNICKKIVEACGGVIYHDTNN